MKRLVIVGASGHGKVIADIAKKAGYETLFFLDDDPEIKECGGNPVVGSSADAMRYEDCDFIIGIGNAKIRQRVQESLENQKLHVVSLVHPTAVIAESVSIRPGVVVMAGSVINTETSIGKGCIINTCSSVDHDCIISDYVHVSVGAHVAGTVFVGVRTWVGAGAVVSNNVSICADCTIGAGAVVVADIAIPGTYVGIPARPIAKAGQRGGVAPSLCPALPFGMRRAA